MSVREAFSMLMRDMPPAWRRVGYFLLAALAIYRAAPLIAAIVNAPAELVRVEARVQALEEAQEVLARQHIDGMAQTARQHHEIMADVTRAVCLLELVTGKRHNPIDCR
jgi:hypothetical protein